MRKRFERGVRERVDRVATDELVHVQRGGVGGVLRRGRRPQRPLQVGAGTREIVPAGAREPLAEHLVRELGVGHRGLPPQGVALGQAAVGLGVDPADEEGRDRRDAGDVLAAPDPLFEPLEVCLDHLLIPLKGKDQRDVDVETRGGRVGDRGQAFSSGRDLDHHVGPGEPPEQILRLGERALRVVREIRVHLDRHEAVVAAEVVERLAQDVGRVGDVAFDEGPVRSVDARAAADDFAQLLVVVGPGRHRLLEDGGVRRDTADPVLGHEVP